MDKQPYYREFSKLAKQICLKRNEAEVIKASKNYIKEVYFRWLYDNTSKPNDRILRALQTPIYKLNIRMNSCLRAYDIINATIADILKIGREKLLTLSGIGKKTVADVDEFLENNGIDWDIDIKQYGL